MNISIKLLLSILSTVLLFSGCAQKIRIKSLVHAEVGEMADKKKIVISEFRNDNIGLSAKIESKIAKHKLDNKRYFTVLNRKNIKNVISEQRLQSSEMVDETTTTKVGRLIGAQAIINGEVASANAESSRYRLVKEKCLKYVKKEGCVKYKRYSVICDTTQASVSVSLNIVDVETGSIVYGDTISKEYNDDSCISGNILSKGQAINRLASEIASEFVYKLTPNYVYFDIKLIESIELKNITTSQKKLFENALEYIKAGRLYKADELLYTLMDEVNGKSYVIAYVYGVVKEARGELNKAKELYLIADDLTTEPVDEINKAIIRIESSINERVEARRQLNAR